MCLKEGTQYIEPDSDGLEPTTNLENLIIHPPNNCLFVRLVELSTCIFQNETGTKCRCLSFHGNLQTTCQDANTSNT